MIEISELNLAPWGRCVKLSNGSIELFATLDFGPRIIRFSKVGGENIFFEDKEDNVNQKENEAIFKEKFGEEKGVWHIRGGHRLWTSPEVMPRNYYPDNEPVSYKKTECGIILTPPRQVWTNLQPEIEVTMSETKDEVFLTHKITNKGAFAVAFAPWAITVLTKGGREIVPLATEDTGLLPNRFLAVWAYTDLKDERIGLLNKYLCLKQNPDAQSPMKLGLNCTKGWAAYQVFGDMFVKYFDYSPDASYPDGGVNFETYTSEHIMEMETLGALKDVLPEETVFHKEVWRYIKDVPYSDTSEEEIDALVEKYI